MAFSEVLYYPRIDIEDEAWLKTALLYWEGVRTIVPESISHPYSSLTAEALQDTGFLVPLRVSSHMEEIEMLSEDVLRFLDTTEGAEVFLVNESRSRMAGDTSRVRDAIEHLTRIHPDKLSYKVMERLQHMSRHLRAREEWYDVDERFSEFYMTLLATRLSVRTGLGLITPSPTYDRLATAVKTDASFAGLFGGRSTRREYDAHGPRRRIPSSVAQGMHANLVLDRIAVAPDTPIDRLIEFRERHGDELGQFRTKIHELTSQLNAELPPEHLRQTTLDIYRNQVKPAISNLKKSLKGSRIRVLSEGLLKIGILSASSSSMLVVAGLSVPTALLATAGISLAVSGIMYNANRSDVMNSNPYSYVLSLEKEFSSA